MPESLARTWKDIAVGFLKVGATAYGGPAIMGVMQAEFQERRQWTSKPRFLEGMALANVLPGATATQLGIFLGYVRGGWWGGLLAGICFAAPAFVVMLTLTVAYAAFGVSPILRGALYGLGPVVLAIFFAALFRLGTSVLPRRRLDSSRSAPRPPRSGVRSAPPGFSCSRAASATGCASWAASGMSSASGGRGR
jgi:chromate transport protein ChrA